jgi:probable HAF family extracellular repeat protein
MLSLACACAHQMAVAEPQRYEYQDLGGAADAYAVNDAGLVVGVRNNAQNQQQAVVWDKQGVPAFLTGLSGGTSFATAINQQGQIVGQAWNLGAIPQAVAWSDGAITTLATKADQPFGQAVGINAGGLIAGNTSATFGGASTAVVWQGLGVKPLGHAGGISSVATSLNDAGLVTGYVEGIAGTFNPQAVVWQGGVATLLPNLASSYAYSKALAVNQEGTVVGAANTGTGGYIRAVVWRNGEVSALSPLGDADMAQGINDAGVVVGTKDFNGGLHRAALWDTRTGVSGDLNALVGEGTLPFNITLIEAHAINNLGDIVGTSYNKTTGRMGAFVLRAVPEPGTWLMFAMGVAGLAGVAMHRSAQRRLRGTPAH